MFSEWRVQELCVTAISVGNTGIITYGVTVDGCRSTVVQPHIQVAARRMGLRIGGTRAGTASPFFTVVDGPSQRGRDAMGTFESLLAKQAIEGPYCDDDGRNMIIKNATPARAVIVEQSGAVYKVDAIPTSSKLLPFNVAERTIPGRCTKIVIAGNQKVMQFTMIAPNTATLARRLRLIANVTGLRWDGKNAATAAVLGEPLV